MKYWFKGLPFAGVDTTGNDPGTMQFWFQGLPDPWQSQVVNGTVNLTSVTATGAIHTLTPTIQKSPTSVFAKGAEGNVLAVPSGPSVNVQISRPGFHGKGHDYVGTGVARGVGISVSNPAYVIPGRVESVTATNQTEAMVSVTAAKASAAGHAGTVVLHGDVNVHPASVAATGRAANPPLHIDSNVPVVGVHTTSALGIIVPTPVSPTLALPIFSIMRNVPVAANGNMTAAPVPAIGAMSNVVAISSLMRSLPVAASGSMSNTPVATTGTLLAA